MAYFSNGTEGEMYQEAYCDKCVHGGGSCAVWLAHNLHNYRDCNDKESVLHLLIPRTDAFTNGQCRMFLKGKPRTQRELYPAAGGEA